MMDLWDLVYLGQENNKPKSFLTNSNAFGHSIFVDEDCKTVENDHPVPMFLEKSEPSLLHESTQMVININPNQSPNRNPTDTKLSPF